MLNFPDISAFGAETTAPAAGTVLADTGAIALAGTWRFEIRPASNDTTPNLFQVARRNAANNADVQLADIANNISPSGPLPIFFTLAANERVVVRNRAVGGAGLVYAVAIFAFFVPPGS